MIFIFSGRKWLSVSIVILGRRQKKADYISVYILIKYGVEHQDNRPSLEIDQDSQNLITKQYTIIHIFGHLDQYHNDKKACLLT